MKFVLTPRFKNNEASRKTDFKKGTEIARGNEKTFFTKALMSSHTASTIRTTNG